MRAPLLLLACTSLTAACGVAEPSPDAGAGPDASASADGGVDTDAGAPLPDYPPGPYGLELGQTVPRWRLEAVTPGGERRVIDLAEYHDPTGARGVAGLHLTLGAVWCAPCVLEAEALADPAGVFARELRPRGGHVLQVLLEDRDFLPATLATAEEWQARHRLPVEVALPSDELRTAFQGLQTGLPFGVTVDPRTMRIRALYAGVDVEFLALGAVLALAEGRARNAGEGPGLCGVVAGRACAAVDPASLPAPSTACALAEAEGFVADCFERATASQARCAPWAEREDACAACIRDWVTPEGFPDTVGCQQRAAEVLEPARAARCRWALGCASSCLDRACHPALCSAGRPGEDAAEAGRAACFASSATAEACGAEPVEDGTVGEKLEDCLAEPALVDASAGCRIEPGSEDAITAQLRAFFAGACVLGGDFSDR